jgi:hypothetical protein
MEVPARLATSDSDAATLKTCPQEAMQPISNQQTQIYSNLGRMESGFHSCRTHDIFLMFRKKTVPTPSVRWTNDRGGIHGERS